MPRSTKRHYRPTRDAVTARRAALFDIVEGSRPATVRQTFYQATVQGLVAKSEQGYAVIKNDLTIMRRAHQLPYDWLADNTRWQRRPNTFRDIASALQDTAAFYRKSLWDDADSYVEIWLEKDALSGVVYPITELNDVALMVARGYSSLSFLYSAAEYIGSLEVPAYIYHLGDYDPSGVNAGEKIEQTLRETAPDAKIHFQRLAVTPQQIRRWNLPTRPTKTTDSRAKKFKSKVSVELDAIPPNQLRELVAKAIERHLPRAQFEVLRAAEESEREILQNLVNGLTQDGDE
ncbi:MAG: hypothetical protein JO121_03835 [Deltaproteobacteria bacterium]|nr:hypothetical protein [Deltaproteobacteria bacterium]